jgi:hypothetical protein
MGRWSRSFRREDGTQHVGQNGQIERNLEVAGNSAQIAQIAQAIECRTEATKDDFDEHAAIVEYDGGIPRTWAEGFARLDPSCPPLGVPLRRWRDIIDGIGVFLDRWAAKAATLGWEAADIFGADATRPEVTWLNAGPLWSGDGGHVVEVHSDHMVFKTRTAATLTYSRQPHLRPRALPWQLRDDDGR